MNASDGNAREILMRAISRDSTARDATRPRYHLMPPARFMYDTWGGAYLRGQYHIFYDVNPFSDDMGEYAIFGHARSSDLIHWENLPPPLWPDDAAGELRTTDGTLALDGSGSPVVLYTRVFRDGRAREHLAARGDDALIEWERLDAFNSVLSLQNHGGPKFRNEWSDPLIFREAGRTFLLMSKCVTPEGRAQIPIYEALDDTLLRWRYQGIFFEDNGEVLNFLKIDDRWVLIYSPYGNPIYYVGDFDLASLCFRARQSGTLSYGYRRQGGTGTAVSRGLYATSAFLDARGRPTLLGWISGFEGVSGWNGCVSLPREMSLDAGMLRVRPHPALEGLGWRDVACDAQGGFLLPGGTFRFRATLTEGAALTLSFPGESFAPARLSYQNQTLSFCGIDAPIPPDVQGDLEIILYVDRTAAELFAGDGRVGIVQCLPAYRGVVRIETSRARDARAQETRFRLDRGFISPDGARTGN